MTLHLLPRALPGLQVALLLLCPAVLALSAASGAVLFAMLLLVGTGLRRRQLLEETTFVRFGRACAFAGLAITVPFMCIDAAMALTFPADCC